MDGFYLVYATGRAGHSILVVVIREGTIVGADVGGMKYDGTIKDDGQGYVCSVVYVVPPGAVLITGAPAPTAPLRVPVSFNLPKGFADGRVIGINTPMGPVNAKFEKVRDI